MLEKLFTSEVFAQAAQSGAPGPSLIEILILPVGFLLIMYLFIIRPQQRRTKEQSNLLANLKTGDEVVTSGGIIGWVKSVADNFVTLEISPNSTIKVLKNHVQSLTKQPQKVDDKKLVKAGK